MSAGSRPEVPGIQRLAVIGVGLIGGSLARALKQAGVCGEVVGCMRSESELLTAQRLGVIDRYSLDPAQAVAGADMVVVAVPIGATGPVLRALAPGLQADAVVTDVGSAKASVIEAARAALGDGFVRFVPGHPIAGTERSGVEASFAELFQRHRVILTPVEETDVAALARVRAMWEAAGGQVECMSAEHHDQVLAATSHLPHVLAYSLVACLADMEASCDIFRFAAGGFRDFTRIASSNPQMWHDISLANRDALLAQIARFTAELERLAGHLERRDGAAIMDLYARAKAARDAYASNAPAPVPRLDTPA